MRRWAFLSDPGRAAVPTAYAGVAALLLILAYAPVVHLPYGVMDDYPSLVASESNLVENTLRGGRPIYALVLAPLLAWKRPTVEDLWMYRATGLALLLVFAGLTSRWLGRIGWPPTFALAAAVLVACLLPMQVFVNWAVTWPIVLAGCIGVGALLVAYPPDPPANRRRLAGAMAIFIVGLATYQPTTLAFFALLVPAVAVPAERWAERRREVWTLMAAAMASMVVYAPTVVVCQSMVRSAGDREIGLPSPLADLAWLFGTVLPKVSELWNVRPVPLVGPVVLATIVVAAGAAFVRARRRAMLRPVAEQALTIVALLGLCVSPTLMVAERWPSFRSLTPLTIGLCLVFLLALRSLFASRRLRPALPAVTFALVAFALFSVSRNTLVYYAVPLTVEWRYVKHLVRERRDEIGGAGRVHVVRPHWNHGVSELVLGDEFGLPASFSRKVPVPMTRAALRAAGLQAGRVRVTHSAALDPRPPDTGPVLDLTTLRELR